MKIKNPMLVVTDINKSLEFYIKVLGLHVIMDFGANKTLTGGLALQTLETWNEFHWYIHSFCHLLWCHATIQETFTNYFYVLANLNNMFIRVINSNHSLSP